MQTTVEQYAGYECVRLDNGAVTVWITQNVGPRIIGLQLPNGDNLLADVPDMTETTPSGNTYRFRGGHRLWHAPEHPERTYELDNEPVMIAPTKNGIIVTQSLEPNSLIEKQMTITLPDDNARIIIDHTLTNRGMWAADLIPWAITMLRPGGFAILPLSDADNGFLPNRSLTFWSYTDLQSPHLHIGNQYMFVDASMTADKLKVGWANFDGWQGYWVDGTLFVKQAAHQTEVVYTDWGSSAECFCCPHFLELETLAPTTFVEPNASVSHREEWRLFAKLSLEKDEQIIEKTVIPLLGLE